MRIRLCVAAALTASLFAQTLSTSQQAGTAKGMMMLTIFLRHDQSKTLEQIHEQLDKTGFTKDFPPKGVEIVSWYVMMGIGQVVTLRVPPDRLREVNRVLEETAWGGFRTEFYPTYDYRSGAAEIRREKGR